MRSTVKNQLTVDAYYDCLRTNKTAYFLQRSFVSRSQHLYLESFKKASLSTLDLKRFWLSDGIQSVPFSFPPSSLSLVNYPSTLDDTFTTTMTTLGLTIDKIRRLQKALQIHQEEEIEEASTIDFNPDESLKIDIKGEVEESSTIDFNPDESLMTNFKEEVEEKPLMIDFSPDENSWTTFEPQSH